MIPGPGNGPVSYSYLSYYVATYGTYLTLSVQHGKQDDVMSMLTTYTVCCRAMENRAGLGFEPRPTHHTRTASVRSGDT